MCASTLGRPCDDAAPAEMDTKSTICSQAHGTARARRSCLRAKDIADCARRVLGGGCAARLTHAEL